MATQQPAVLLVEDEPDVRRLMARMLEGSKCVIEEAENGATALQAARRLNGSLRLVVTDIDMPVMNGLDFARAFRETEPAVPILFVTGSHPAVVLEPELKGEVLAKPFAIETFLGTVMRLLTQVARRGQPA